jgi:hypothetical protein
VKKLANIVCTYFGERRKAFGSPTTLDDVISNLQNVVKHFNEVNPGCETDLIIINHVDENTSEIGVDYLKSINGLECNYGTIITHNKENIGGSPSAFSYALGKYEGQYEYFLLSEDDRLYNVENYGSIMIEEFEHDPQLGFLIMSETKTFFPDETRYTITEGCPEYKFQVGGAEGMMRGKAASKLLSNNAMYPAFPNIHFKSYANIGQGEIHFFNNFQTHNIRVGLPKRNNLSPMGSNPTINPSQQRWIDTVNWNHQFSVYLNFQN